MRSFALVAVVAVAVALAVCCGGAADARSFTQSICADSSCSIACQTTYLSQDMCYVTNRGYTGTGRCEDETMSRWCFG